MLALSIALAVSSGITPLGASAQSILDEAAPSRSNPVVVSASPLPASADPSSDVELALDHVEEPTIAAPQAAPTYGRYVAITLGGQFVGALLGATLGLVASVSTRCVEGEGWVSGYNCGAGYGVAAAMGAVGGALLGGGLAQLGSSAIRGYPELGLRAFAASCALLGGFATTAASLYGVTEELTAALGVAGAVTLLIELFALPSQRPDSVRLHASIAPLEGGFSASVGGVF